MLLCCTTHGHSRLQAGKHKCNPHPTSDSYQNSLRWLLLLAVDRQIYSSGPRTPDEGTK
jgi:hypothetical protein